MKRVAVLLTCHNRKATTLACLERLARQDLEDVALEVVVCDAGSTDGTPEAITAVFPAVQVVPAESDVYWNAGMRRAWEFARTHLRPDFVLWLNDDTLLDEDGLRSVIATFDLIQSEGSNLPVVVGAARDPLSGAPTYGGVMRPDMRRPLSYTLVPPGPTAVQVETMNGNVVLVPEAVTQAVGLLDSTFSHGMGDFDYGHRVRRAGGEVWLAPGTVGTCGRNPSSPPTSFGEALRRLSGPKGLPVKEWVRFAQRWAGPLWPIYAVSPYARRLTHAARSDVRRKLGGLQA